MKRGVKQGLKLGVMGVFFGLAGLAQATPSDTPKGLSSNDWARIRAAYEQGRRELAVRDDGRVVGRNPGQGWAMEFDGSGFAVRPKGQNWTWGLELRDFGRTEASGMVNAGERISTEEDRLVMERGAGLAEWYVNGREGLMHGFTVSKRPEGAGELELRFGVRGELKPRTADEGRAIAFVDASGATVLRYAGLLAWDAAGRKLAAELIAEGETVALRVDDRNAVYPVTIDPVAQQVFLKASNAGTEDQFGESVAISGDTVVVGASRESSGPVGINGTPDETENWAGAVYVFVRAGGAWTQQALLKASNAGFDDRFGMSVGISGDTVVVGAPGESSGPVGINGTPDEGATRSGAAYVFVRAGGTWTQQAFLKAPNADWNESFGRTVDVSGNTVVVASRRQPEEVLVFVREGSTWTQQATLKASSTGDMFDRFGISLGISGDTVVVGADREDSGAVGINGTPNEAVTDAGAAYVFVREGSAWTQQAFLKASNAGVEHNFGVSVGISGNTVVVGADSEDSGPVGINGTPNSNADRAGAAYVFVRNGSTWTQQAFLKASNAEPVDYFGTSVAISNDTVVVGAIGEDSGAVGINGTPNSDADRAGAAYVFVRNGSTWTQQAFLKASNAGAADAFGCSVAVSGSTVVVGAFQESSGAVGINGTPNEGADKAGAAYGFTIQPPTPAPVLLYAGKKAATTARASFLIQGKATGGVTEVSYRTGNGKWVKATGTTNWRFTAQLRPGVNTITIVARGPGGESKPVSIKITRRR